MIPKDPRKRKARPSLCLDKHSLVYTRNNESFEIYQYNLDTLREFIEYIKQDLEIDVVIVKQKVIKVRHGCNSLIIPIKGDIGPRLCHRVSLALIDFIFSLAITHASKEKNKQS